MSSARKMPLDQKVRDRLTSEFDKNFLVEAGAGSGKTYSLAMRMAAGIAAGKYTVEHIAVVTFTRKAAAELRGRFQLALEDRLRAKPPEVERQRLETALAGIERLFAGTIHAFCAHLLRERPVDARIAPGFEELSDMDNLRQQRAAWREFVAQARAGGFRPMLDLLEAGIRPPDLDDAFGTVCEHEDVEFDMGAGDPPDPKPVWKEIDRFWAGLRELRPPEFHEQTTCNVQQRFEEFEGRLRMARRERVAALAGFLSAWGKPGVTQKYWGEEVGRDKAIGKQVKDLVDRFQDEVVAPFQSQWRAYVHRLSMAVLVQARDLYAQSRRRQNVVNYVDLLRVTATMLRSGAEVRRALQRKYQVLFIDEFQDTDPIQAEIFLMLAGEEASGIRNQESGIRVTPAALDPFALRLRPGTLFVVGDPKQSIYRFRRADIDIYNRVAQRIRDTGGEVLAFTANFRSLPSVCAAANTVFPPLFANWSLPYSPRFEKLEPVRVDEHASSGGASRATGVAKITIPDAGKGSEPEKEEAARIAAYIQGEVASGRRKYGDFLILNRQTPRLRVFADAFDALEIPVDVSGAGLFCESGEVQALAALLTALADPLDSVALVGVLRGPLFGLSDPDLFRFHQAGGRFEVSVPLPDDSPVQARLEPRPTGNGAPSSVGQGFSLADKYGPVLSVMRQLQAMWRSTRTLPLAAAVDRILEDTGWLALAATTPGGAGAGRLLQAVDRVRQVVEDGGGLREAAGALNEEERSSESEALPLEPGRRDVVRLMNLHKAKGLEADVVFLADATHAYEFGIVSRVVRAWDPASAAFVARGYLKIVRPADQPWKRVTLGQPLGWETHEEEESKYRDAEGLRLLYVAGTRAKDLLVVCRSEKATKNKAWGVFESYLAGVPELETSAIGNPEGSPYPTLGQVGQVGRVGRGFSPAEQMAAASARAERHDLVRQPSWAVASVTGEKARLAAAERAREAAESTVATRPDGQVPDSGGTGQLVGETGDTPGHRADAGVAWGSLIHGLLEHAMRHEAATRGDLDRLARWLTVETPDLRPFIPEALDLVQAVSRAPFWQDARAGGDAHVEAPFAVRLEPGTALTGGQPVNLPTVLHGTIDLVYRAADGWRILDYKTDQIDGDDGALLARHAPQLAQYRLAWERATGGQVGGSGIVALRTLRVIYSS